MFRRRSGLTGQEITLFDRFSALGGLAQSGNAPFGGHSLRVYPSLSIGADGQYDKTDEYGRQYVVDFAFVVKAFLYVLSWVSQGIQLTLSLRSHTLPEAFPLNNIKAAEGAVQVIRRFLKYLQDFNICPEYNLQLNDALNCCDIGTDELCDIVHLYKELHDTSSSCFIVDASENMIPILDRFGSEKWVTKSTAFEVLSTGEIAQSNSIGIILAKEWKNPAWPKYEPQIEVLLSQPKSWTFYVSQKVLRYIRRGMKMEAIVHETTEGRAYFDSPSVIYCSFYTFYEPPPKSVWIDSAKKMQSDILSLPQESETFKFVEDKHPELGSDESDGLGSAEDTDYYSDEEEKQRDVPM
jgi:hypothetical protein